MKPVTLWSVYTVQRKWKYNHLENGHAPFAKMVPTSMCEDQKRAWGKQMWTRRHAYLNERNEVVYV